jgi:acetylglutamate synthase
MTDKYEAIVWKLYFNGFPLSKFNETEHETITLHEKQNLRRCVQQLTQEKATWIVDEQSAIRVAEQKAL